MQGWEALDFAMVPCGPVGVIVTSVRRLGAGGSSPAARASHSGIQPITDQNTLPEYVCVAGLGRAWKARFLCKMFQFFNFGN